MSTHAPVYTREHYLNASFGWKSWLFTRDHKRIALLFLATIAAIHSDQPTFWLLIGPAPLASGLTALTVLRRK